MKKTQFFINAACLLAFTCAFQSCDTDDESYYIRQPTALVTVCPQPDESFLMQLDEVTKLRPVNMKSSPFGSKEVRALVSYNYLSEDSSAPVQDVNVIWIDSIRTKNPVIVSPTDDNQKYGEDPLEIVKDWVTIAEDGYLTLRIRTLWGYGQKVHTINLLSGLNPDNPLEFELRHNANGDIPAFEGDALIAFNLNNLLSGHGADTKIKVRWMSFSGEKSAEFTISQRNDVADVKNIQRNILSANLLE